MPIMSAVGESVRRTDSSAKVTGNARYVVDLKMAGMLHVAVHRSVLPHARIVKVDASQARALPGVVQVLTGEDVIKIQGIDVWYGPAFRDQAIVAIDKVRYIGDIVAAVLAEDRATAQAAAELVDVEYEELPAILDVRDAFEENAPLIHDVVKPAKTFADLAHLVSGPPSNTCYQFKLRLGDVDKAFAEADHVFEGEYWTPPAQHATMEPHATLAYVDELGKLIVWSATQSPSFVRQDLSSILGLPLNRIRVLVPYLGGGFGAKLYDKLEPICALFAILHRRPIKWVLDRNEEFLTITKHGVLGRMKTAVKDGKIIGRKCEVLWDTGAYADIGPRVVHKSGFTAGGPYKIPNLWIDSYCVYTNKVPAGAYRGFGVPQVVFPYESQMDEIAAKLQVDPLQFRLQHALREGDRFATGTPMHSAGIAQCLDAVSKELGWATRPSGPEHHDAAHEPRRTRANGGGTGSAAEQLESVIPVAGLVGTTKAGNQPNIRRGRGIAVGMKAVLTPSVTGAIVILNDDASATVMCSTVEMGQGSETILAQIAADFLGLKPEKVSMVQPDTDVTPYDTITAGSRSTFHAGLAIKGAADEIRQQLFEVAADLLEAAPDQLDLQDEKVIVKDLPERSVSITQVFGKKLAARGSNLLGQYVCRPDASPMDHETGQSENVAAFWFVGATALEVAVDVDTGRIVVERMASAADVGRAINPHQVRQQILGAGIMGLSHALYEYMAIDDGQVTNASFLEYTLPSYLDVPDEIIPIIVENEHDNGPFNAKGVGETGILTVTSAIANAVYDATGVRVRHLPVTAEKVLCGLKEGVAS